MQASRDERKEGRSFENSERLETRRREKERKGRKEGSRYLKN